MISSLYFSVIGALLVPTLAQTDPPSGNCSIHEVWNPNCFLKCLPEPSCIDPFPQPPETQCGGTICGKCLCAPGFIRYGPNGTRCIAHSECPKYCSYPHKEYRRCGYDRYCPPANNSQRRIWPLPPRRLCFEGCFCEKPYLLDEQSHFCVLPEYCPE